MIQLSVKEHHDIDPEQWVGHCEVCGNGIDQYAIVDFIEGEEYWPYGRDVDVRMKDMDRVFLWVGPCGHTSLDQSRTGNVFTLWATRTTR